MRAYVGLGANLGDARATLVEALRALAHLPRTALVDVSPYYVSAPVDAQGPDYWNAVAEIETALTPHALLTRLLRMEARHGRLRPYRNAPRTLDLDLLLMEDLRIASPRLTVPHPRLTERAFALRPLLDLAPGAWIPGKGPARRFLHAVRRQRLHPSP